MRNGKKLALSVKVKSNSEENVSVSGKGDKGFSLIVDSTVPRA